MAMTAQSSERQEIEELLPWHAAGTLSAEEAQRVENALAHDAELARRYALVREELGETAALHESLGAPSRRAYDRLMAAIDAEPARAPARSSSGWLASFLDSLSPRALAWSGAAAALVIVLQAGVITSMTMQDVPATFQTASGPPAPGAPITRSLNPNAGTFVQIRFAAQTTSADLTRFLADNRLSIVEGPLANGLYRVKLADTALSRDEITRTVRQLQSSRLVELIATQ
jgi:hypothetical protein